MWHMINLPPETEELAERLARAQHLTVETVIRQALETLATLVGLRPPRRRQSAEEMLAAGLEVARMPLLDKRTSRQIVDDINAPE
jgi:hypothetical protein